MISITGATWEATAKTTGGFVQMAFNAALDHNITSRIRLTCNVGYSNDFTANMYMVNLIINSEN